MFLHVDVTDAKLCQHAKFFTDLFVLGRYHAAHTKKIVYLRDFKRTFL